jgi:2-polyprenyl-3-methyl-5-hydroxy-6-metoxy-1,4-benzoquinol methylase
MNLKQKIESGIYTLENVPCLCGNLTFNQLATKERRNLPLAVVICQDCGLVQANPRMNQAAYSSFYNNEYRTLQSSANSSDEVFFNIERKRGRKIFNSLQQLNTGDQEEFNLRGKLIVEIGSGAGGILSYFQDKGCQVFGLDLGEKYVEAAKARGIPSAVGSVANLVSLKPDMVLMNHLFEHLLNPKAELSKLRDLPTGTIIYIAVPGLKNLIKSHGTFIRYLTITHVYYYSQQTLLNTLLAKGGFKVRKINEEIECILERDDSVGPKDLVNDYHLTTTYLSNLPKFSKKDTKLRMISILKKIGAYSPIRDLYFKIRKFK